MRKSKRWIPPIVTLVMRKSKSVGKRRDLKALDHSPGPSGYTRIPMFPQNIPMDILDIDIERRANQKAETRGVQVGTTDVEIIGSN